MKYGYSSWLDRLVGACCSLLVAATAIYLAVRLVESIWVGLAIVAGVLTFLMVSVIVWRWWRRSRAGW